MIAYLVSINVKEVSIEDFKSASVLNAKKSFEEPGILRFDLIQQEEDPTKFMLIEVYKTEEDTLKHKQTEHYLSWRDTVSEMMAEPRVGVRYEIIHPTEELRWLA
jgi:quinol monooxygenase YgiN